MKNFGWIFFLFVLALFPPQLRGDEYTDTDKEARKKIKELREEINMLNLINGLNLTVKQMERMIPLIEKAVQLNYQFCQNQRDHNQQMVKILQQFKGDLLKKGFIPKYTELSAGLADLRDKKQVREYYRKLNGLESELYQILTPAQRYVLKGYSPCLIPPKDLKDPVRVGQADSSDEYIQFLARVREISDSDYSKKIGLLLDRHLSNLESHLGKYRADDRERELRRLRHICDEVRKCSDLKFELKKGLFAKKFSPQGQIDSFKHATEDFISLVKRFRGAVGKVGKNFFHPAMVKILKTKIQQIRDYRPSNTPLDKIKETAACKDHHCAIDEHHHLQLKKKPTIEEIKGALDLKDHQEKQFRAIIKKGKDLAMKILSRPAKKGVVPFKSLVKAFQSKNPLEKKRAFQDFYLSLFEEVDNTTYMEALTQIQIEMDQKIRKILSEEQYFRFSLARIDYLDIEVK